MKTYKRRCQCCPKVFTTKNIDNMFCSKACREVYNYSEVDDQIRKLVKTLTDLLITSDVSKKRIGKASCYIINQNKDEHFEEQDS